jgi:hypothetical protein
MNKKGKRAVLDWMGSNSLITATAAAVLAAILGMIGYFGKSHFDSDFKEAEQVRQFRKDTYKKYHEKSKSVIQNLRKSRDALFFALQEKYGFSTFEIEKPLLNFRKAVSSYNDYVSELELYGSSNQIASAKELQNWSTNVFSEFSSQYQLAKEVQDSIQEMIVGSYKDSAKSNPKRYVDFHLNGIIDDKHKVDGVLNKMDKMIQEENDLYYADSKMKCNTLIKTA